MNESPAKASDIDHMIAALESIRREFDPNRVPAEQAAHEELVAKYPGQFVAYVDSWDDQKLTRDVLAVSRSAADVRAAVRARGDYEAIRRELRMGEIRDPNDDGPWIAMNGEVVPEEETEAGDGAPGLPL